MASVRDELVDFLVDKRSVTREVAEVTVDNAIAANAEDERFGTNIEATVDHIVRTPSYWTFSGTPKPIDED